MAQSPGDSLRESGIKKLKENYSISGDGVAHRRIDKAVNSSSFRTSVKKLVGAKLKLVKNP